MELSIHELAILIGALGTEDAEYGLSDEARSLLERLREVRARRVEEARSLSDY